MIAIKNKAARACLVRLGAIFSSYFLATAAYAMLPIEHWRAPNGAQVWLIHSPGIPMVDVQIALDGGRRRDSAEQAGLSHAVALMSGKGVQASGSEAALDENALVKPGPTWARNLLPKPGATASATPCARSPSPICWRVPPI